MTSFWTLLEDGGALLVLFAIADGGVWAARHADRTLAGLRRRHERKDQHREALRQLELKAKRRELEIAHPELVKPICGCGHDLAFHHLETNACRFAAGDTACTCQRYVGPQPVGEIYLPPLSGSG